MEELNSIIVQTMEVSPIMRIIRVKPNGWELPEFKPGQFIALALPASANRSSDSAPETVTYDDPDKLIKRAYSIASSSTQEFVEFYITLVHSGSLTPRLFNLKVGDKVWMGKKATGMFTLDQINDDQNVVMIATGTGVAPYMSMLRSNILHRKGKLVVIHGAANSWDLGYSSELQLLETMFPNLYYLPTITEINKEPAGWSGDTRFIEDIWKTGTVAKKCEIEFNADNTHIFLCGNPKMINGMKEILVSDGYAVHSKREPGQIHYEEFF